MSDWREAIEAALAGSRALVLRDEPMAKHTSMGVGGPVSLFVRPDGPETLASTWRLLMQHRVRAVLVGGGTNLLVADSAFPGCVVWIDRGLDRIQLGTPGPDGAALLEAGAGAKCSAVAATARDAGLTGAEFLAGIPGNMGGAVAMNAGTRKSDVSRILEWIDVVGPDGTSARIEARKLGFGYRRVNLSPLTVVSAAAVRLRPDSPDAVEARMREDLTYRRSTQPQGRNCGSVFTNPPGQIAGKLVEAVGLKGKRIGNAAISSVHANWIENLGGATAADVMTLIALAQEAVRKAHGVELELEVRTLGDFSQSSSAATVSHAIPGLTNQPEPANIARIVAWIRSVFTR